MSIKIYTLSTCHYCDKTIDFLRLNGVEFETIVMDRLSGTEQEVAIAEAYRLSGQRSYPVTDINGTGVIGFDVPRFRKFLGIEAVNAAAPLSLPDMTVTVENSALEKVRSEAAQTGYLLNPDEEIVKALTSGLMKNNARYGYRSCPCRLSTGDYNKDCDIICPCAYRDQDIDEYGRCYCGLYVTEDFARSGAKITPIPDSRKSISITIPENNNVDTCEVLNTPGPDIGEVIKVFAYSIAKEGRELIKVELESIAKSLGIERIIWHGETAEGSKELNGGKVALSLLQGMEAYVYMLRVSADKEGRIGGNALQVCTDSLREKPNELYALDIFIGKRSTDLLSGEIKGQRLKEGTVVMSGFASSEGVRKYVVTPGAEAEADKIIDDIVRIETCYNLLLSQRQKYLLLADQLGRLEERIATKMGVINLNLSNAEGEVLKGWLHFLSVNFGELSGVTEEMKKHASDTEGRRNVLHSILERWEGEPLAGLQTISEPLRVYTKGIGDDYGRLTRRVDGIRREMGDVITILRTKVDLIQQEQSLDIQKSMHETAKTQLSMQRAVESLEVFIVTYYLTSLSKITFEALEAQGRHLPDKPIILAGYLIPVFFLFSIFLSGKIGHLFEGLRKRFRGKGHE